VRSPVALNRTMRSIMMRLPSEHLTEHGHSRKPVLDEQSDDGRDHVARFVSRTGAT
jgi:hypothetical protein